MILASFAAHPDRSRGRLHKEPEAEGRSPFRRDCDRIIHSSAFRRLEYKTQVFVNHEGDHYRTRLTHSLEVAQIARALSRNLNVNEDLAETLALSHDLGHTPFGHAGEEGLNQVMQAYGGFSHNAQTLKILTKLEHRYAAFEGLNLTWETLEGITKHNGPITGKYRDAEKYTGVIAPAIAEYNALHDLELQCFPTLEAQIAALSDDIAYHNHDLDDGVRAGLFTLSEISELPLVGEIIYKARKAYPEIQETLLMHEMIRSMIGDMIRDVKRETTRRIEECRIKTVEDVHQARTMIVAFSEEMEVKRGALKQFLMQNMYRHYRVNRMTSKARRIVKELFNALFAEPNCLPTEWRRQAENAEDARKAEIVADFIAGMTDRFAMEEYRRLFDMNVTT